MKREADENEKLRSVKADRLSFGGGSIGDFNSDLSAEYPDYCHLLCFGGGNGICHREISMKGGNGMQVVVVKAPRYLRGILKRVFKIRNEI